MPKRKLSLADLITDKELAEMRKDYNRPQMTKQEAYSRKQAVADYLKVLQSFKVID